jgi:peptidyl-Asp metalloendopeptidase
MDGTTVTSATLLNPKLGSTWDIVGVGQFKGVNGPEAIVWQDSVTGEAAISEWNATTQTIDTTNGGSNYVQYSGSRFQPGAGWKIEGVGDYNGDGISDLLWRNGSSIVVWGMGGATGTMLVTPYAVAQPLAPSFKAVGSANFNGDGTADMLYRDATADRTIMLTFKIVGGSLVAMPQEFAVHPGSTWQIQGLADFNGDSNTDIVWRNTANTGANPLQTAIWALDGVGAKLLPGVSGVITTATNGILQPASDWNIVGTGNFGSV